MTKLAVFLFVAGTVLGQSFCASKAQSLSGAATAVTVQQPIFNGKTTRFHGAWVDCSVACTLTLKRDGSAASATSLTVTKLNSGGAAATATAFYDSNVGAGTSIATYNIPAGGGLGLDLSAFYLTGSGTTKNLTLAIGSITGNTTITICWNETN